MLIKINNLLALPNVHIGLAFKNFHGQKVCTYTSTMQDSFGDMLKVGQKEFHVEVLHLPLIPGHYSIELSVVQRGIALLECHNNVGEFTVLEGDFYGTGRELTVNDGFFFVNGKWS